MARECNLCLRHSWWYNSHWRVINEKLRIASIHNFQQGLLYYHYNWFFFPKTAREIQSLLQLTYSVIFCAINGNFVLGFPFSNMITQLDHLLLISNIITFTNNEVVTIGNDTVLLSDTVDDNELELVLVFSFENLKRT